MYAIIILIRKRLQERKFDIMNDSKIRNVVVLGHQGSGKTSLVESLYAVVNNTPKGSIEKKNTISDYLLEEKNRLSSVRLSVVPINYNDYTVLLQSSVLADNQIYNGFKN